VNELYTCGYIKQGICLRFTTYLRLIYVKGNLIIRIHRDITGEMWFGVW